VPADIRAHQPTPIGLTGKHTIPGRILATSRRTIATAFAGFAFASLMLVGCSAGGSGAGSDSGSGDSGAAPSSQTTEEACTVLKDGVTDTMTDLQSGLAELQANPDKAAEAVGTLAAAFEDTAKDVKNKDVRTVADEATESLNDFSDQITAYAADPTSVDQTSVTDSATAVQSSMTKLGATCP
jgi:hypothetical protein